MGCEGLASDKEESSGKSRVRALERSVAGNGDASSAGMLLKERIVSGGHLFRVVHMCAFSVDYPKRPARHPFGKPYAPCLKGAEGGREEDPRIGDVRCRRPIRSSEGFRSCRAQIRGMTPRRNKGWGRYGSGISLQDDRFDGWQSHSKTEWLRTKFRTGFRPVFPCDPVRTGLPPLRAFLLLPGSRLPGRVPYGSLSGPVGYRRGTCSGNR